MADRKPCDLQEGEHEVSECEEESAEMEVTTAERTEPNRCEDSVLSRRFNGGRSRAVRSCGLSLDSSDHLEAFTDTIARRVQTKKIVSVDKDTDKGMLLRSGNYIQSIGSEHDDRGKGMLLRSGNFIRGSSSRGSTTVSRDVSLSKSIEENVEDNSDTTTGNTGSSSRDQTVSVLKFDY